MMMLIGFFLNILFMNFNNPLILSILMLMQTLNLILMMGKIYYSFWFSYIIFLVFIGGLFILFIYMITLMYNNKYYYFLNLKIYLIFLLIIILLLKYMKFYNNYESNFLNLKNNLNFINLLKLYNFPNNYINLMLINFLLMMMIIVVKITNFSIGPIKLN